MTDNEKEQLLQEIESLTPQNIPASFVGKVIVAMVLVVLLCIPKIYVATQIYYKSLELHRLKAVKHSLYEENLFLRQEIERKKFDLFVVGKM